MDLGAKGVLLVNPWTITQRPLTNAKSEYREGSHWERSGHSDIKQNQAGLLDVHLLHGVLST